MALIECIKEIIGRFTRNDYFDSHTIINELTRNKAYHLEYLRAYSKTSDIRQHHKKISEMIETIEGIEEIGTSKYHTIYGNITENKLWQKK